MQHAKRCLSFATTGWPNSDAARTRYVNGDEHRETASRPPLPEQAAPGRGALHRARLAGGTRCRALRRPLPLRGGLPRHRLPSGLDRLGTDGDHRSTVGGRAVGVPAAGRAAGHRSDIRRAGGTGVSGRRRRAGSGPRAGRRDRGRPVDVSGTPSGAATSRTVRPAGRGAARGRFVDPGSADGDHRGPGALAGRPGGGALADAGSGGGTGETCPGAPRTPAPAPTQDSGSTGNGGNSNGGGNQYSPSPSTNPSGPRIVSFTATGAVCPVTGTPYADRLGQVTVSWKIVNADTVDLYMDGGLWHNGYPGTEGNDTLPFQCPDTSPSRTTTHKFTLVIKNTNVKKTTSASAPSNPKP